MLFDEVENVLVLEGDVKLSQKSQILIPERATPVVLFLIVNIPDDCV